MRSARLGARGVSSEALALAAVFSVALLSGCGRGPSEGVIRLIDEFREDMVQGTPTKIAPAETTGSWNFGEIEEGAPAMLGWKAGVGVSGLEVRDGRLRGRSTTDFPIIWVELEEELDAVDLLHAVEVRMRVSRGANMMASSAGEQDIDFKRILEWAKPLTQPWPLVSPIIPGNLHTLTLRPRRAFQLQWLRKLMIRPSDVAGADFEMESVRVVTLKQHLSRIPAGVGWHGMGNIFRETLVARSPESITFDLDLRGNPWLDLHLGTLEESPVTFSVRAASPDTDPANGDVLLERTITTPDRWEAAPVELAAYAGREVSLQLSVSGDEPGMLGFWGGPAIRDRGGIPARDERRPPADLVRDNARPQGVILMMADTLRRDHLQPWGYERETAPTLTRLASRGAVFKDNISQATWTKTSATTLMTSLYPSSHRVLDMADLLPAAAVTMAEVFRDAGYATLSFSANGFTGKSANLHQGYEELHEPGSLEWGDFWNKSARPFVDRLSEWLEVHRAEPFFVFLHVLDPHTPVEPRRPYGTIWSDPKLREQHDENVEKIKKAIKHPRDRWEITPSIEELTASGVDREQFMSYTKGWYDGSIRGMDAEITRLMERLRELGLDDKTLFVLTSDHGEGFHEHGLMLHGQTVYGELANVPLIFHGPSFVPEGLVIGETVRSIDVMPTVLELSGLPAPDNLQGQSLVGLMAAARDAGGGEGADLAEAAADRGWEPRGAFVEKNTTERGGGPIPYNTESFAVIHDGWKLIRHTKRNDDGPEFELFDHRKDRLDRDDLAESHPEMVERLKAVLEERRHLARAVSLPETESLEGMSDEELRRLRSLGYID